jgi:uncharacterized membrane protein
VIELTDMAVKALSPGVNDPTTAILCLDRIAEVLLAAGRRTPPAEVRRREGSAGTLILPRVEFAALVDTALDEIRHYGVENPRFAFTFLERMGQLGHLLPHDRRTPVARHTAALLRAARRTVQEETDLRRVEKAGQKALAALGVTEEV